MSYSVLVRFSGEKDRPLSLADSQEELQQTTVTDLKQKCAKEIPGAPGKDLHKTHPHSTRKLGLVIIFSYILI